MSRPLPTRSRLRRAGLVLAAVVALGACSHNRAVPESYGSTIEDNFTDGCEISLTDDEGEGEALSDDEAADACSALYDCLSDPQDGLPYEELKELNDAQEDEPEPLQEPVREVLDACRGEAGLS